MVRPMVRPDEATIDTFVNAYQSGKSYREIGEELGISRKIVSHHVRQRGIQSRKDGRKYTYNTDTFTKIDSEAPAYWLGFCYADASVSSIGRYTLDISLSTKDYNHLEKLRDWICLPTSRVPLAIRHTSAIMGGKQFESCRLSVHSKEIVEDLLRLGCVDNKTKILTFPTEGQVPNHLIHHFMRGYLDGDGSVGRNWNINVIGTESFIHDYSEILHNLDGITRCKVSHNPRSNYYYWTKTGKYQLPIIYNFLYDDATIYLERKYNRFQQLFAGVEPDYY